MRKDTEKDTLYNTDQPVAAFRFDENVADVFSDMIERSVPGYRMMLEMIGVITHQFARPDTHCYDLGCSLGASTQAILHNLPEGINNVIAVDNSPAMIERCQQRLLAKDSPQYRAPLTLLAEDILALEFATSSLMAMNFTLQFIALEQREPLLKRIADALIPGGALVLSEKITFADDITDQQLIDLHHGFKRARGYSELEVAQKRNALENVLIPETIEQHRTRLLNAGFSRVELWFQCFNFVSMLAIK